MPARQVLELDTVVISWSTGDTLVGSSRQSVTPSLHTPSMGDHTLPGVGGKSSVIYRDKVMKKDALIGRGLIYYYS